MICFANFAFAQRPMSKELIQEKVDSIQVEQDELYRFFRAEKIAQREFNQHEHASWITYLSKDSVFVSNYLSVGKRWSTYYLPNHLDSFIWINSDYPKSEIIQLIRKKDSVLNKLNPFILDNSVIGYDFIFYPQKDNYKVYYLSATTKDLIIPRGLDQYFLLDQNLNILKQDTFHKEYDELEIFIDDSKITVGLFPRYEKTIPFVFATDIVKFRWYKTDELEYYRVYCPRNRQSFEYHYKVNKITFGL